MLTEHFLIGAELKQRLYNVWWIETFMIRINVKSQLFSVQIRSTVWKEEVVTFFYNRAIIIIYEFFCSSSHVCPWNIRMQELEREGHKFKAREAAVLRAIPFAPQPVKRFGSVRKISFWISLFV